MIGLIAVFSTIASTSLGATSEDGEPGDVPLPAAALEQVSHVEQVQDEEVDWEFIGLKVLDAVVLRPLGAVTTAGGFVAFLVSAPFVAPSGNIGTAWDVFVHVSYDETFVRPLGEI